MSSVSPDLILASFVPATSFLAALSLLVMTASSYGARCLSSETRMLLWFVSFAFASQALRVVIRLLTVAPPPISSEVYAAISAGVTILANLSITSLVVHVLVKHALHVYRQKGINPLRADFSLSSLPDSLTGELSSYGRGTSHA